MKKFGLVFLSLILVLTLTNSLYAPTTGGLAKEYNCPGEPQTFYYFNVDMQALKNAAELGVDYYKLIFFRAKEANLTGCYAICDDNLHCKCNFSVCSRWDTKQYGIQIYPAIQMNSYRYYKYNFEIPSWYNGSDINLSVYENRVEVSPPQNLSPSSWQMLFVSVLIILMLIISRLSRSKRKS